MHSFAALKSKNPNLKLIVAAGGYNDGAEKFSYIARDPHARNRFATSVLSVIQANGLDGFDFDWEYPVSREGVIIDPNDYVNFILQLTEFRNVFNTNSYPLSLSAAVAACQYQASQSYDIPKLSQTVDFINLMTYDMFGGWDGKVNIHSALYGDPASVDVCVRFWLYSGAERSKIIVGIPTYGGAFTLADPAQTHIGAPAYGAEALPYKQICASNWQKVFDQARQGPYAFSGNQWVGFDDKQSVAAKVNFIKNNGLGGAMFWSLELDDFRNECASSGMSFPLIRTAHDSLIGGSTNPTQAPTQPPPTNPSMTTSGGTFQCPSDGMFRNPSNCNQYYLCSSGDVHLVTCGAGTCFNQNISTCDWCDNVDC